MYKEIRDMTVLILSIKAVLNFPQKTSQYMMIFSPSDGLETDVLFFLLFLVPKCSSPRKASLISQNRRSWLLSQAKKTGKGYLC